MPSFFKSYLPAHDAQNKCNAVRSVFRAELDFRSESSAGIFRGRRGVLFHPPQGGGGDLRVLHRRYRRRGRWPVHAADSYRRHPRRGFSCELLFFFFFSRALVFFFYCTLSEVKFYGVLFNFFNADVLDGFSVSCELLLCFFIVFSSRVLVCACVCMYFFCTLSDVKDFSRCSCFLPGFSNHFFFFYRGRPSWTGFQLWNTSYYSYFCVL